MPALIVVVVIVDDAKSTRTCHKDQSPKLLNWKSSTTQKIFRKSVLNIVFWLLRPLGNCWLCCSTCSSNRHRRVSTDSTRHVVDVPVALLWPTRESSLLVHRNGGKWRSALCKVVILPNRSVAIAFNVRATRKMGCDTGPNGSCSC